MLKAIFVAFLVLLSGCGVQALDRAVPFNEAEYQPFAAPGDGGIDAQVFMRTEGGSVVTAAGEDIVCTPVTAYSTEFFKVSVLEGRTLKEPWTSDSHKYFSTKRADADGRVKFRNLPTGRYYVWGNVRWKAYDSNKYVGVYDYNTGGVAYAIVDVKNGQITEAIATR